MLYILTLHLGDKWIDIQKRQIERFVTKPYKVFARLGDHPEIIKGFAKIAGMMSEDKIVSTESENVSSNTDVETEISDIMNNKDGPYWNRSHPDHDKVVQQVYTLREMITK